MRPRNGLKRDVLDRITARGSATAAEIAADLWRYRQGPAAAYLLKLTGQGLLTRGLDRRGVYAYRITEKGRKRLDWLTDQFSRAA